MSSVKKFVTMLMVVCLLAIPASGRARAADPRAGGSITLGVLSVNQGPAAAGGADGLRGVAMAVKAFGGKIDGKKIRVVEEGTDQTGPTALSKVRKLVAEEHVDIVIGPGSGDEGLAVANYAKSQPQTTFIDGIAAGQKETWNSSNVFRFAYGDGAQWVAGLGNYARHKLGIKRVATLGDNYSFGWAQVGGFVGEFCAAGGRVPKEIFAPLGASDYSSVVPQIPTDVQAIYIALNGADSLNFLKAYYSHGGHAKFIASSITVDQSVLSAKGSIQQHLIGVYSASPLADNLPMHAWKTFVRAYRSQYPNGFSSPSVWAIGYYINTTAALLALRKVHGNLSGGEKNFQKALARVQFTTPTGPMRLDSHRNGLFNTYITVTTKRSSGLYNRLVKTVHSANENEFLKHGAATPSRPSCP